MRTWHVVMVLALFSAAPAAMAAVGARELVAEGEDPDLAIHDDGTLHLVYVRDNAVRYRQRKPGGPFGAENALGAGADPAIALGPDGEPHIAFVGKINGGGRTGNSTLSYTRRHDNEFRAPALLVAQGGCCKPRLRVDNRGVAVVVFQDRRLSSGRVRWLTIAPDGVAGEIISVGEDNPGGLSLDSRGHSHLAWRLQRGYILQYTTVLPDGRHSAPVAISPPASDFSDLVVRPDGSVHVVGEVAHAGGLYYIERTSDGHWLPARVFRFPEAVEVDDPDNVNPALAVDDTGRRYVTFTGAGYYPYVFVIDEYGNAGPLRRLDSAGGRTGGKYMNPHIAAMPGGGACVVWASQGNVYVTTLW